MHKRFSPTPRWIVLALVIGGLLAAGPALAGQRSIVGSWDVVAVDDATGEEALALFTYNRGGTFDGTAPAGNISSAAGAWERIGPRTFACTFLSYVYGPDGSIALRVENRHVAQVSSNGQHLTATFDVFVTLPDGTPVENQTATGTGTRIRP